VNKHFDVRGGNRAAGPNVVNVDGDPGSPVGVWPTVAIESNGRPGPSGVVNSAENSDVLLDFVAVAVSLPYGAGPT